MIAKVFSISHNSELAATEEAQLILSTSSHERTEAMADQNDVDLDSIIDRLLEVRGSRPGKQVQLLEAEIRYLCTKAREIFISQPILLELEAPIKVCSISVNRGASRPGYMY